MLRSVPGLGAIASSMGPLPSRTGLILWLEITDLRTLRDAKVVGLRGRGNNDENGQMSVFGCHCNCGRKQFRIGANCAA